jgi:hypothetical protein
VKPWRNALSRKWKIAGYVFGALFIVGAVDRYAIRPDYYIALDQENEAKRQAQKKIDDEARAKKEAAEAEVRAKEAEIKARAERVGSDTTARLQARVFVSRVLKAPTSAKFSEDTAVLHDDDTWSVKGYVDSQNSFGAMLRSTYLCKVQKVSKDEWRLVRPCELLPL